MVKYTSPLPATGRGTIDGNLLWQPRFGFNYTFDSERPMQLRGGIGLFQGAAANVWLSNPFTNTGMADLLFHCLCTPRFRPEAYLDLDDADRARPARPAGKTR